MSATVGARGGWSSPLASGSPLALGRRRRGNPTAEPRSLTRWARIQTGRAAGGPRLLREAARLVGGADSGDPGSGLGWGGPQISGVAECVRLCGEPAWDWGSRGRRRRGSKQAEVFPPFKVMLKCLRRPTIASLPRRLWGVSVH